MNHFNEFIVIRETYRNLKNCMVNDAGNVRAIPLLNNMHEQLNARVKNFTPDKVAEAGLSIDELEDWNTIVDDMIAIPSIRESLTVEIV